MTSATAWLGQYPRVALAVPAVARLVASMRADGGNLELEARLGVHGGDGFRTGVSRERMDAVLGMMQDSSHVSGDAEWQEDHDYFFDVAGAPLRSRVHFDTNSMMLNSETIRKVRLGAIDLESGGDYDVRVALAREAPVCAKEIPASVMPSRVRIMQRRRFCTAASSWAFDFKMTWTGCSVDEAERMQQQQEPRFEIECELVNAEEALRAHSDEYLAASLLLKMSDFLEIGARLAPLGRKKSVATEDGVVL